MDPVSKKSRWVSACDQYGDLAKELRGSREGLTHLRSQIDEALEKGVAETSNDVDFSFERIRVQENDQLSDVKPSKIKGAVAGIGCALLIILALLVFVAGIYQIIEIFSH